MSFSATTVGYGDGHTALLVQPPRVKGPLPAVLLIQEAWGIDEHIEDVAGRLARAGYAVLAPDLLSRHGQRPEVVTRARVEELKAFIDGIPGEKRDPPTVQAAIAAATGEHGDRVRATTAAVFGQLGALDAYTPALLAATAYLRAEQPLTRGQELAAVGFCMGGALSGRLACADPELAGAAIFYGSAPPAEQAARIRCPLIGFYAEHDERINAGIPAFAEGLAARGVPFERHSYPGSQHAFFNDTRGAYHVGAARDAWSRLLTFLVARLAS
jgi:carboxymethylenebutenolidase